jgi:hypothetical protein
MSLDATEKTPAADYVNDPLAGLRLEPPSPSPFVDHEFPMDRSARWLRPHEIVAQPRLFVDSSDSSDVVQGALADCWFLSALAVVALRPVLLRRIFASSFTEDSGESGRYTFEFFKGGDWTRVTIDDRLPCDASGQLLYARSAEETEMWVALVEKAYAKLHGSYAALKSGTADVALRDLTGGAPQRIRFGAKGSAHRGGGADAAAAERLWEQLQQCVEEGSPVGCAFALTEHRGADARRAAGAPPEELGARGILRGHACAQRDSNSQSPDRARPACRSGD